MVCTSLMCTAPDALLVDIFEAGGIRFGWWPAERTHTDWGLQGTTIKDKKKKR